MDLMDRGNLAAAIRQGAFLDTSGEGLRPVSDPCRLCWSLAFLQFVAHITVVSWHVCGMAQPKALVFGCEWGLDIHTSRVLCTC